MTYVNRWGISQQARRLGWNLVRLCVFLPSPILFHAWRRFLLRLFGAKLGRGVHVYPNARIWAPWNLEMGDDSCLGQHVDCYNVDRVVIGRGATVSQWARLCTASHDIRDPEFGLITRPIVIGAFAWVAYDVFVGPGVTVGDWAVLGARAAVFKDVAAWIVVGGNPARQVGKRKFG